MGRQTQSALDAFGFNTDLGRLRSVTFNLETIVQGEMRVDYRLPYPQSVTGSLIGSINFAIPGQTSPVTAIGRVNRTFAAGPNDALNGQGVVAEGLQYLFTDVSRSVTTLTSRADLDLFTRPADDPRVNLTYTTDFLLSAQDDQGAPIASSALVFPLAGGKSTLRGTITYEFGSAVPEAATWAMMIAGFGLVGYALRRRRALASL